MTCKHLTLVVQLSVDSTLWWVSTDPRCSNLKELESRLHNSMQDKIERLVQQGRKEATLHKEEAPLRKKDSSFKKSCWSLEHQAESAVVSHTGT